MAKVAVKSTRVYLDEFDLSGSLTAWDMSVEQELPDVTAISDAGPRRLTGNYDEQDSLLGLFEPEAGAIDDILHALIDADDHYLLKALGTTEGDPVYEAIVRLMRKPLSGKVGGAVLLNLEAQGTGGSYRGVILRTAAVSGAGNGTGQNLGATTTGQELRVTYRVVAFNGTDITLTIEESQNDGSPDTYAAISGLTQQFTAVGVAVDSTTAATEAWKRVAITGTFTTATILVTIGTVQGTD